MVTDRLALARGVIIFPTSELPAAMRKLARGDHEFALTRMHSRGTTKLLDARMAALLECLKEPSPLIDAVLEASTMTGEDPHVLLEHTYPTIRRLLAGGFLRAESATDGVCVPFAAGERFGPFLIERQIQISDDACVYKAVGPDDQRVALKVASNPSCLVTRAALAREAAILSRMHGGPVPALVFNGSEEQRAFLATRWLEGTSSSIWAARIRRPWSAENYDGVMAGLVAIADAYTALHRHGVVHGDVHPRNVIMHLGVANIVDFSLSEAREDGELGPAGRGGAFPFYEPEWALARLARLPPPPATELSDQYGLGVLFYELLTGAPYLVIEGSKRSMMRQIASAPPLPFRAHGIPCWPELEGILARALAKEPADRFESTEHMARALRGVLSSNGRHKRALRPTELLSAVEDRLDDPDELPGHGLPVPPYSSVNYGAAGIAYLWYRLALLRGDSSLLWRALRWIDYAHRASDSPDGFGNRDIKITPKYVGQISIYHSMAGVHCVKALILNSIGDRGGAAAAAAEFALASQGSATKLDLVAGRSSTLVGAALLIEALGYASSTRSSRLHHVGDKEIAGVWDLLRDETIERGEMRNWALAHGWAGILYATARWCEATDHSFSAVAHERLAELASKAEQHGGGLRRTGPNDPGLPGSWCNGSAGYTHLWAVGARVTGEHSYLELCLAAAEDCWRARSPSGDLCCGAAGQAYAMLAAYAVSHEEKWLHRSEELAQRSLEWVGTPRSHTNALYKGDVGIALLAADLQSPTVACMPLFGPEGWRTDPASVQDPSHGQR